MPYVGYSGVTDQANTSDGFAFGVGAKNIVGESIEGADVGDGGVVDLYGGAAATKFYIADESDPGYVLQEDDSKIVLEAS